MALPVRGPTSQPFALGRTLLVFSFVTLAYVSLSVFDMDIDSQLRRALDDFKVNAELTNAELQFFQFRTFEDVRDTLNSIQEDQSKKKRLVYMRRIDPFLKAMTEYSKVIEVFLNTSDILAFIWASPQSKTVQGKSIEQGR